MSDIMDNSLQPLNIENKILVIRGQQVMLDRDLAELYGVETMVLNQAVKRNIERFPEDLNKEIVLIDNYVDLSVLQRLSKKQNGVDVKINTSPNPL